MTVPILRTLGLQCHPVGPLTIANMTINNDFTQSVRPGTLLYYTTSTGVTFNQQTSPTPAFGTFCGQFSVTTLGTGQLPAFTQQYPVTPLQPYTMSMYVNVQSVLSQAITILGYVLDSTGATLYDVDGITPLVLGGTVMSGAVTSGWVRTSMVMTPPIGAGFMNVSIGQGNMATALDSFYVNGPQFEPASSPGPYVNGGMNGFCWSGSPSISTTLKTGQPSDLASFVNPAFLLPNGSSMGSAATLTTAPGPAYINPLQS